MHTRSYHRCAWWCHVPRLRLRRRMMMVSSRRVPVRCTGCVGVGCVVSPIAATARGRSYGHRGALGGSSSGGHAWRGCCSDRPVSRRLLLLLLPTPGLDQVGRRGCSQQTARVLHGVIRWHIRRGSRLGRSRCRTRGGVQFLLRSQHPRGNLLPLCCLLCLGTAYTCLDIRRRRRTNKGDRGPVWRLRVHAITKARKHELEHSPPMLQLFAFHLGTMSWDRL